MRLFPISTLLALSLLPLAQSPAQLIPRKPAAAPAPASPPASPSPAAPAPAPALPPAVSKPLKAEDTDRLIQQLAEIEANLQAKRSSYNSSLLAQLKEAGNSEEKSYQLWLDATKEFEFDEKGKTSTEWAEWKRTRGKELHNMQFMTGLRLQTRFLSVLILYANALTENARAEAIAAAAAYLEDLAASAKKLDGRMDELSRPALDGIIAKHLKLDSSLTKAKNEAARPGNVQEIYEKAILPYYREREQTAQLLAAWQKLISQETAMIEAEKIPEKLETFTRERLPMLKWSQARDMYQAGQEEAAMAAMLALIKNNLAHKQTGAWIGEMGKILQEKKEQTQGGAPIPAEPADGAAASPPAGAKGLPSVPVPPAKASGTLAPARKPS